jgi:hypothetical protein
MTSACSAPLITCTLPACNIAPMPFYSTGFEDGMTTRVLEDQVDRVSRASQPSYCSPSTPDNYPSALNPERLPTLGLPETDAVSPKSVIAGHRDS